VLRSVTLSVALLLLVGACELTTLVADMHPLQVQVRNLTEGPVDLTVETPDGAVIGAARPPSLPASTTVSVTFLVPVDSEWSVVGEREAFLDNGGLVVPDGERETLLRRSDLVDTTEGECPRLRIEIHPLGGAYACLAQPP
jgi:hypothetical protein